MPEGARRLAAIMFTDLVGFTALGQKNESLALSVLDEQRELLRPMFNKHGGREIKTIGDSFLVDFPSALSAVKCAYEIQKTTREFNSSLPEERRVHVRIGVHLGDIVESQGDISGDAVNVASRIESLADSGGVYLTRQVYDQVQNKFELPLRNLGAKLLKNIRAPTEVFKMVMPWEGAMMADAHVVMADYGMMPKSEFHAKVREYAMRALEIDPTLSQPHAALATVHERNFRWADAENEYKLAVKLSPSNATAHHWYALDLSFKRSKNAIWEWRKAKELDPLSLIIGSAFGYFLVWSGHKQEGLEMLRSVIEMNDGFVAGHRHLAFAYIIAGMNADAVAEAKKIVDLSTEPTYVAAAACAFAKAGLRDEAIAILNRLLKESDTSYVDPSSIALIYAALLDEANALEWLEKAVDEKSAAIPFWRVFPLFEFLQDNSRFREISKKMGLG